MGPSTTSASSQHGTATGTSGDAAKAAGEENTALRMLSNLAADSKGKGNVTDGTDTSVPVSTNFKESRDGNNSDDENIQEPPPPQSGDAILLRDAVAHIYGKTTDTAAAGTLLNSGPSHHAATKSWQNYKAQQRDREQAAHAAASALAYRHQRMQPLPSGEITVDPINRGPIPQAVYNPAATTYGVGSHYPAYGTPYPGAPAARPPPSHGPRAQPHYPPQGPVAAYPPAVPPAYAPPHHQQYNPAGVPPYHPPPGAPIPPAYSTNPVAGTPAPSTVAPTQLPAPAPEAAAAPAPAIQNAPAPSVPAPVAPAQAPAQHPAASQPPPHSSQHMPPSHSSHYYGQPPPTTGYPYSGAYYHDQYRAHIPPPPPPVAHNIYLINTSDINENDVLCGRGGLTNQHVGNKKFRALVKQLQEKYITRKKHEKTLLSQAVVAVVRGSSPAGRFLKQDVQTGMWYDIGDDMATEKTSQAFREKSKAKRYIKKVEDGVNGKMEATKRGGNELLPSESKRFKVDEC